MKNRRLYHLRYIGTVQRRSGITFVRSSKTDLVVNNDMHCAARVIAARLGQAERFHDHALSGESRIAMQQYRQYLAPFLVAATMLTRAHRAFYHRINDFKVRWVKR